MRCQKQVTVVKRLFRHFLVLLLTVLFAVDTAWADLKFIDLTHEIPTFAPLSDDPIKPDLSKPVGHSEPIAGFYHQAILYPADQWATSDGYFNSAAFLIQEHNGTSFNSPNHYVNNVGSLAHGGIPQNLRKSAEALTIEQLTGKVVLIDISKRVSDELAKNGGKPSPDKSITDFSDSSRATVRSQDIEAVADKIDDGIWLVARLGWEQFYSSGIED